MVCDNLYHDVFSKYLTMMSILYSILEHVDPEKLYTSPEQVYAVYTALSKIGPCFSIAAAFGNVHGVYKPGNVKLSPERLGAHQAYAKKMLDSDKAKPLYLVMHGGSGSTDSEIQMAVSHGVVKMNIDTDTQWAYWDGIRLYEKTNRDFLRGQIGNPKGPDKPNKKYYDPRVWIRAAEETMMQRVGVSMEKLSSKNTYTPIKPMNEATYQIGTPSKYLSLVPSVLLVTAGALVGATITLVLKSHKK